MTGKHNEKAGSHRVLYWVKGYVYLTATVLGLVGLFLVSTAWATRNSDDSWLGWRDPLLGITNRAMLVVGGLLHLAAAVYLFTARDLLNRTLATLWMGLNHLMYYAGVHLVEPSALPNAERFIGWRLQLQPGAVDVRWKIFQGCLVVASIVFLILIWRHSKHLRNDAWFKQWQETRSQHPKERPAASKQPQPAEDYTKNVCSHCGQKVAFPLSRVGESIFCPHCAARITLREPPANGLS